VDHAPDDVVHGVVVPLDKLGERVTVIGAAMGASARGIAEWDLESFGENHFCCSNSAEESLVVTVITPRAAS